MSAAAPNPNNLLMLAVLGIGAYYIFSRRAIASTIVTPAGTTIPGVRNVNAVVDVVGNILGRLGGSGGSSGSGGSVGTPVGPGEGSRGTAETATRPYIPWEEDFAAVNPGPGYSLDSFFGGTGGSGD